MAQQNISIGSVTSWQPENSSAQFNCANGKFSIQFCTDAIVRLRYTRNEFASDFSYAVIAEPQSVTLNWKEEKNLITATSSALQIIINKKTGAISFFNLEEKLLNTQDKNFAVSWIGEQVSLYNKLQDGERFIGLGEKTGNLDRRGSAYEHWNTDYFGYPTNADPLYCSTPFYIGVHADVQYGIFLDNTHRSIFNFGASNHRFASISADAGEMNYYFIGGKNVSEIIENYSHLTGKMQLPPKWSLGFQQCRYSYYPDSEVLRIAKTFREKKIPCDVIYLDIHYMDKYKCFTFDEERFAEPEKMLSELKQMGFNTTVILDPGVAEEKNYSVYDTGKERDVFVKYPDGENYTCNVWPGKSCLPDFTKEDARAWWKEQMKFYTDKGVRGFWNDMNEPASWGQRTPDLIEFDFDGRKTSHREARNVYGMQMARATYEGAQAQLKNERPFMLTRAGFSGIQRYAAVWTGDNVANDEHMLLGVRLLNSLGLAGVPFAGVDVGGFCGTTTPALFARWISIAAFSPFFRVHKMINAQSSEPWSYGEEVEDISRNYISLRYRLMPYLYSLFYKASLNGTPVVRTLALDYVHDANVYAAEFQNQFLLGDSILVCPVASNEKLVKIYLPEGEWFDLYNNKKYSAGVHVVDSPLERLPVFVKAGAIIPMQSLVQSLQEKPDDVLELHVYNGESSFNFYEDDGASYDFEKGKFSQRKISVQQNKIALSEKSGDFSSPFKRMKIYLHGFEELNEAEVNGKKIAVEKSSYRFLNPISNFDPFFLGKDSIGSCEVFVTG